MENETTVQPLQIINSMAPVRICDNGGWTDTWFARYGKVFNIAVSPCAESQIEVYPRDRCPDRIVIHVENYQETYAPNPKGEKKWDRHPLLEAAIERIGVPRELAVKVTLFCEVPHGASTGTSSAMAVALIGALDRMTPGRLSAHEVAYIAQSVEVDMLKQQCGIQDQLCSAYGGINYIEMDEYPRASVSQSQVSDATWWELERRLVLIYLGEGHNSSRVHEKVIQDLEGQGPGARRLEDLRVTAEKSRDAVCTGDFEALGRAMIENTEAQGRLHAELINPDAQKIIEIAREHGAVGWKVNGAGGVGGSVTILGNAASSAGRALVRRIEQESPRYKHIPISLSRHGLRVWNVRGLPG